MFLNVHVQYSVLTSIPAPPRPTYKVLTHTKFSSTRSQDVVTQCFIVQLLLFAHKANFGKAYAEI